MSLDRYQEALTELETAARLVVVNYWARRNCSKLMKEESSR